MGDTKGTFEINNVRLHVTQGWKEAEKTLYYDLECQYGCKIHVEFGLGMNFRFASVSCPHMSEWCD